MTDGNLYLAAFAGGITIATRGPRQRQAFDELGELIAELLKLAALLVFGAFPGVLERDSIGGWIFAVLAWW